MSLSIGFIGLGVMGRPMALRLLDAGNQLIVVSRTGAATAELLRRGAIEAATPADVAAKSDAVITMLPDTPDVENVAIAGGILEALPAGGLFIDMSTIAPHLARTIASIATSRGIDALDAPVSGGETGAKEGTLSIMVGGAVQVFERAQPIFSVLGKRIVHVGTAGAGQVAKAANQVIVAGTIAAVAEALSLAARAGVDPARVREALQGGFADSRILQVHGQRMLDRNFQPGFRINLQAKDIRLALDLAREVNVPLRLTPVVARLLDDVIAAGGGDLDHAGLVTAFDKTAS